MSHSLGVGKLVVFNHNPLTCGGELRLLLLHVLSVSVIEPPNWWGGAVNTPATEAMRSEAKVR